MSLLKNQASFCDGSTRAHKPGHDLEERSPSPECQGAVPNLQCRDAPWAIKALRDEPLPPFAPAADRERRTIAKQQEPEVDLRPMTEGHKVILDYSHTGLTLRRHPVAILRNAGCERTGPIHMSKRLVERSGNVITEITP